MTIQKFIIGLLITAHWLVWPGVIAQAQTPAEHPNDILIVVNLASNVSSISIAELKSFFLKQKSRWNDGTKVVPIHTSKGTAVRKAFSRLVLSMTAQDEEIYWQQQRIRKGLNPPPEFKSPLRAVYSLKGSVSYIFRKDYLKGVVKIIRVLPHGQ